MTILLLTLGGIRVHAHGRMRTSRSAEGDGHSQLVRLWGTGLVDPAIVSAHNTLSVAGLVAA